MCQPLLRPPVLAFMSHLFAEVDLRGKIIYSKHTPGHYSFFSIGSRTELAVKGAVVIFKVKLALHGGGVCESCITKTR